MSGRPTSAVEPVQLGVVGAGFIARAYADLLASGEHGAVAAGVADVVAESAKAMADRLGCRAFDDPADLVEVEGLEAVVLCTPPATHVALTELFAQRGVHVLSEKPLARSCAEAEAMVDAAERGGVLLSMATKFRFCADVVAAAELVAEGAIGDVRLWENGFTSALDMTRRWQADPSVSGGGVIIDNGTHSFDLLRFMVGPVTEVLAVEMSRPATLDVEDTVRLFARTENGVDASIDLSWSIDKSLADLVRVYGTEGEIRVGYRQSTWRRRGEEWQVLGAGYAKLPAMGGALAAFCRAVRATAPLAVTPADALAAAAAVDAAYASLDRGGWASVTTGGV